MNSYLRVVIVVILIWLFSPLALAQEEKRYPTFRDLSPSERLHYNEAPDKILPDAKTAYEKGNYERSIMLCSMHWAYYGDSTEDLVERQQLDASAKKCYDFTQDMTALVTERNFSEAKRIAGEILKLNPKDKTAQEVQGFQIKVKGVEVLPVECSVQEGETVQLTANVSPADAENKAVVWISGDSFIASVNQEGMVKGEKPGRVMITVLTKDGDFTATCAVTVTEIPKPEPQPEPKIEPKPEPVLVKATGIEMSKKTLSLEKGKTWLLSANVRPNDAANKSVLWSTGDDQVASVNYNGFVTAVGDGSTFITATAADGHWQDSCRVVVNTAPEPVKEAAKVEKKAKSATQKAAVMVAPTVGVVPGLSYGLMAGYVGKVGGYAKFRSNFVNTGSTYDCTGDGMSGSNYIWTTGNTKVSLMSITAGALFPIGKSVIPYVGVGYAKRELAWEDVDGAWARVTDASVSGIGMEAGLMLRFGLFGIHAGVNTVAFKKVGIDAGIALFF